MAAEQSTVGLFNLALGFLGGEQLSSIQAPWEDSTESRLCQNNYPHALRLALSAHNWSFAMKIQELAEKPEDRPVPGFERRFALPVDCLKPIRLEGDSEFIIQGKDLLSNDSEPRLYFVAYVDDPAMFSPSFFTAMAWQLAALLATAKNGDKQQAQYCGQQYNVALAEAASRDNNQQRPYPRPSHWHAAKRGNVWPR